MALVEIINNILTRLFGFVIWPLQSFDPIWALILVSLLTGLLMLWLFGKVSRQEAIRRVKNKIRGNLLAIRLFQHDVRVVLQVQGRILRETLTYVRYSLTPMLVLIVPVMLIIIQLNHHFSIEPLRVGEAALVQAKLSDPTILTKGVSLDAPVGVTVETPAVRIETEGEVAWRIRVENPGRYPLQLRLGDETVEKQLVAGEGWGAVSALRTSSLLDLILYPGEASIEQPTGVESVEVKYRPLPLSVLGWNLHWLVLFFILSIVFAFALKGLFGVEI